MEECLFLHLVDMVFKSIKIIYKMRILNIFESTLLEKISDKYPEIKSHLPYLLVENIQITGVGMYINFLYKESRKILNKIIPENCFLSVQNNIQIKKLEYGLGYEVIIKNGKIEFIEIITYGELWDGDTTGFIVIDEQ